MVLLQRRYHTRSSLRILRSSLRHRDATTQGPPSEYFEVAFGIEAQLCRIADCLDLGVPEGLVDHTFGDVEVLEVQGVRDANEARLFGRDPQLQGMAVWSAS